MMKCCVQKHCMKVTIECLKCKKVCCMKHIQCELHQCDAPVKPLILPPALVIPKVAHL